MTRGSRAMRRTVRVGWEALTPAEVTVARLVAEGESNPDIAARLFLSRRTVEAHIAHIFRKLQVRRRPEIAQIARDPTRQRAQPDEQNAPRPPAPSPESRISGSSAPRNVNELLSTTGVSTPAEASHPSRVWEQAPCSASELTRTLLRSRSRVGTEVGLWAESDIASDGEPSADGTDG